MTRARQRQSFEFTHILVPVVHRDTSCADTLEVLLCLVLACIHIIDVYACVLVSTAWITAKYCIDCCLQPSDDVAASAAGAKPAAPVEGIVFPCTGTSWGATGSTLFAS